VRSQIVNAGRLRSLFHDSQITFGVMPSPQIRPALLIDRKIQLSVIPLAKIQPSMAYLT